ncbi:MAG: hypothetical protein ACWGNV_10095 [Bacteroidales bacterium]
MKGASNKQEKHPPDRSRGLLTDILFFLLHRPGTATLIRFDNPEERDNYNQRVIQRLGIDPNHYSVLNIHKIGVEAPVSYVFNELLQWNGDSTCWPNYIAHVDRIENDLKRIRIQPFGWHKYPFRWMKSFFGLKIIPLFLLNAIRIKIIPDPFDFDNARYLLYKCTGGYPIGIFALYVRSSIPDMGETAQSQLISAVGFNFYGKEDWQKRRKLMSILWESIHNRVTSNVLNRLKQLCEWRIESIQHME